MSSKPAAKKAAQPTEKKKAPPPKGKLGKDRKAQELPTAIPLEPRRKRAVPILASVTSASFLIASASHHTFICWTTAAQAFVCGRREACKEDVSTAETTSPLLRRLETLEGRCVRHIATGHSHCLVAIEDGNVLASGENEFGQLGLGPAAVGSGVVPFTPVPFFSQLGERVLGLAVGQAHSIVLVATDATPSRELFPFRERTHRGTAVYTFGCGTEGCLGTGSREHAPSPLRLEFFDGRLAMRVAAGRHHSVVLCPDRVFVFGIGAYGGTKTPQYHPYSLFSPTEVTVLRGNPCANVAAGGFHTLFELRTGRPGVLGRVGVQDEATKNEEGEAPFHFLDDSLLKGRIRGFDCGRGHCVLLLEDGVYCWGDGEHGQLGLGKGITHALVPTRVPFFDGRRVLKVAAGCFSSFAVTDSGLFAWGDARYGKLGIRGAEEIWEPCAVRNFESPWDPPFKNLADQPVT
eukprot:TRINITY_DN57961_c0_g1_i1.p1 TRINITY_DN57961_c0_g1~~TRINITY_DN57961_c0_g1_i1.p1  ORF type:complete len:462 (-),score=33.92 TRINITY_DN57961_c0_g1_i1:12-1397(-)